MGRHHQQTALVRQAVEVAERLAVGQGRPELASTMTWRELPIAPTTSGRPSAPLSTSSVRYTRRSGIWAPHWFSLRLSVSWQIAEEAKRWPKASVAQRSRWPPPNRSDSSARIDDRRDGSIPETVHPARTAERPCRRPPRYRPPVRVRASMPVAELPRARNGRHAVVGARAEVVPAFSEERASRPTRPTAHWGPRQAQTGTRCTRPSRESKFGPEGPALPDLGHLGLPAAMQRVYASGPSLLRRIASSRAFLILLRSLAYERPTRIE